MVKTANYFVKLKIATSFYLHSINRSFVSLIGPTVKKVSWMLKSQQRIYNKRLVKTYHADVSGRCP